MHKRILSIILISLLSISLKSFSVDFQEIEQDLSDSLITAKIKTKFTEDKLLNPLKISVSTEDGIVVLKGHVKNKYAYIKALQITKNTKGVKKIESDKLHIRIVNTKFTDLYITTKVEAAILKAKVLDDESIPLIGINAKTKNGKVVLTGNVKQNKSILAIIDRVKDVNGVKEVTSHLKVKKARA